MKKNEKELQFFRLLHNYFSVHLPIRLSASPKTIKTYKAALNQMRLYLAEKRGIPFTEMGFSCFRSEMIYDFLVYMRDEKQASANTLNNRLAAIRSFLQYCSDEDMELTSLYVSSQKIRRFKGTKKPKVEYLTESQLKLIFSIPDINTSLGRRNRFMMIFLYETGTRIEELLNLRLSDVIRTDGTPQLKIIGKGRKVRYVPVMEDALRHLEAYLYEFHKDSREDSLMFYTVHQGEPTQMSPANFDSILKKYAVLARETDSLFPSHLHAHMFRHSIAMAMYKKGVPLSYIRDFLGHESIDTVRIYAYADSQTIEDALKKVNHEGCDSVSEKKWKGKESELLQYCCLK
jgi:site-specific recombinase XerD